MIFIEHAGVGPLFERDRQVLYWCSFGKTLTKNTVCSSKCNVKDILLKLILFQVLLHTLDHMTLNLSHREEMFSASLLHVGWKSVTESGVVSCVRVRFK